jgi:hypothetical protein
MIDYEAGFYSPFFFAGSLLLHYIRNVCPVNNELGSYFR